MAKKVPSHEFSICLMCNARSAERIYALRKLVPPSPYRDDRPHITLIRGVHHDEEIDDKLLQERISAIVDVSKKLPVKLQATTIRTLPNYRYRRASFFGITAPAEFKQWRKQLIKDLEIAGFRVEQKEKHAYVPHVTIRLGVGVHGKKRQELLQAFGTKPQLTFETATIFRISFQDSKPLAKEIAL